MNAKKENDNNEDRLVLEFIKLVKIFPADNFLLLLCEELDIYFFLFLYLKGYSSRWGRKIILSIPLRPGHAYWWQASNQLGGATTLLLQPASLEPDQENILQAIMFAFLCCHFI